jgi:hypothetical protein
MEMVYNENNITRTCLFFIYSGYNKFKMDDIGKINNRIVIVLMERRMRDGSKGIWKCSGIFRR